MQRRKQTEVRNSCEDNESTCRIQSAANSGDEVLDAVVVKTMTTAAKPQTATTEQLGRATRLSARLRDGHPRAATGRGAGRA